MIDLVLQSTAQTAVMVIISTLIALCLGGALAIALVVSNKDGLYPHAGANLTLGFFINAFRSIPYIILTVLMMPLTRLTVGSSIGVWAAIVPLSVAGSLLIARQFEESLRNVPAGLIEVGRAIGASKWQIIRDIYLPESLPSLIAGTTTVVINLIGFSAMAGAVGGGGLGDLAIRYGYQRYDLNLLIVIVLILIAMVQLVQFLGNYFVSKLTK